VDANEFLKKVTPAAQRSRLAPFWNDITQLRDSNCTLEQVCEFLAANGVQISIAGLSKYIKRREEKGEKAERVHAPATSQKPQRVHAASSNETPAASPQLTPKGEAPDQTEPEDDLAGKSQIEANRIRRERKAQQFIKEQPTNSLIKNLKDKQS